MFRAKSACHHIQTWWRVLVSGNKERSVLELKRAAIAKHALLAFEKKERFLTSLKSRRSKETNRMNNNNYKQFLRVGERNILLNTTAFCVRPDLFALVFSTFFVFRPPCSTCILTGSGVQQFNQQREECRVSTLHASLGRSGYSYLGRYVGMVMVVEYVLVVFTGHVF